MSALIFINYKFWQTTKIDLKFEFLQKSRGLAMYNIYIYSSEKAKNTKIFQQ